MTTSRSTRTPILAPESGAPPSRAAAPGALAVAAIASLGAGAIHAAAAGAHSDYRAAVIAFTLTAVAQLGWGVLALGRWTRLVSLLGAAVNAAALGGWIRAKTAGIDFVAGLDASEPVRFADALAAALALVAAVGALAAFAALTPFAALAPRPAPMSRAHPVLIGVAAIVTVALVIPGMVATSSHSHAAGHGHGALPPPVPYLATLPVDLSGVPGVSEQEVAEAEALVTETLRTLPRYADIATVTAMGYRTIGDADTGFEHFVNWELVADGRVLDPDHPESLVFAIDPATGGKTLTAAMFAGNPGDTLETVPRLGGALVQWHIHDDLCFEGEPSAWRVAEVVAPDRECAPATFRLRESVVPMVHVWIVPHECGPFAALEGLGAGQIRPGEERLCDHAHGAVG